MPPKIEPVDKIQSNGPKNINTDLNLGMAVVVRIRVFKEDEYVYKPGTVRYVGVIDQKLCAGIEMDKELVDPYGNTYGGRELFQCPSYRGYIAHAENVFPKEVFHAGDDKKTKNNSQAFLGKKEKEVETEDGISITLDQKDIQSSATKAPLSNLLKLYQCPVCLEIFENPYTLPCEHPLCKECLDGLIQTDGGICAKCPLCNATYVVDKEITTFKSTLTMRQTLEYLKASRPNTPSKQKCQAELCEREVTAYCINWKTYLCDQCKNCKDPHQLPDLITYKPVKHSKNQDNLAAYCHLHESFETHCCTMCNELCCIYCTQSKHKDHDVVLVKEFNENNFNLNNRNDNLEEFLVVKNILENIQEISENHIGELKSNAAKAKELIRLNKMKLIAQCIFIANNIEDQMLSTLNTYETEQCDVLQKRINDISLDIVKVSSIVDEVEKYQKKNQIEKFYHHLEIKETVESKHPEQTFKNKYDVQFEPEINISNKADHSDALFTLIKDQMKFIKVSSPGHTTEDCFLQIPKAHFHKNKAYNEIMKNEDSVKSFVNMVLQTFIPEQKQESMETVGSLATVEKKNNTEVSKYVKMEEIDDNFREEGSILFVVNNISKIKNTVLSEPVMIRNLPWYIMVMPRFNPKSVGIYVHCDPEGKGNSWSCQAHSKITLKNHKGDDLTREINHLFNRKEDDWGYSQFICWNDIVDPAKGYNKNDQIMVEAHIQAEAPKGVVL